jgi:hypothetical protein
MPAPIGRFLQCLMSTLTSPITIAVLMKCGVNFWLQIALDYLLGDPVRYRRNTKSALSSCLLINFNNFYFWRKVASLTHTVP